MYPLTAPAAPARVVTPPAAAPRLDAQARFWGPRVTIVVCVVWAAAAAVGFTRSLQVLTALGFLAAAAGFFRPVLGLFGVALLCTLDAVSRSYLMTGGIFRWNSFNYLLLLALAVSLPRVIRWRDPAVALLFALVIVLGVGLLFSNDLEQGVQHILGAVSFFGLLVYVERAGASSDVWSWAAVIASATSALGGLVYFVQDVASRDFMNPNAWAFFPLTGIAAISLALYRSPRSEMMKKSLLLLAAVNATWIFLSGSRGASLTALACLVFSLSRARGNWPIAVVGGAIVAVTILSADPFEQREESSLHRMTKLFDPSYTLAGRTSGRSDLAKAGWYLYAQHPVRGIGTGSFSSTWVRLQHVRGLSRFGLGREMQAHSGWIKTLAENGTPGILLHAAFVASFLVLGIRRGGSALAFGILVTVFLSVAFLSTEFQGKGLWFVAAAATMFLRRARTPRAGRRSAAALERPASIAHA